MKVFHCMLISSALMLVSASALAQFVKGNEAVKVMPNGTAQADTPPLPTTGPILRSKPCLAAAGCNAGPWHMIETSQGLLECTEAYALPIVFGALVVVRQRRGGNVVEFFASHRHDRMLHQVPDAATGDTPAGRLRGASETQYGSDKLPPPCASRLEPA